MSIFRSVELLKEYFQETSCHEIEAGWKVVEDMNLGGPSVEDLLSVSIRSWVGLPSNDVSMDIADIVSCDRCNEPYALAA